MIVQSRTGGTAAAFQPDVTEQCNSYIPLDPWRTDMIIGQRAATNPAIQNTLSSGIAPNESAMTPAF